MPEVPHTSVFIRVPDMFFSIGVFAPLTEYSVFGLYYPECTRMSFLRTSCQGT